MKSAIHIIHDYEYVHTVGPSTGKAIALCMQVQIVMIRENQNMSSSQTKLLQSFNFL